MILTIVAGILLLSPAYVLLVLRDSFQIGLQTSFIGGIILFIIGLVLAVIALNKRQALVGRKPA